VDFSTNDWSPPSHGRASAALATVRPSSSWPAWIRVQVTFRHGVHDADRMYIDWDSGTGRKGSLDSPYGPRVYSG